jgi:5-methylcytosine-specific restriction endonuclease McrA
MPRPNAVTSRMILNLLEKQGYRCALSGRQLTPETASIDHVLPLSRGGRHAIENLCIVDHQVNVAKGTLTLEEFVCLCREVAEHFAGRDATPGLLGTSGKS